MNITLNTTMKDFRARYALYLEMRYGKNDTYAAPLFSLEHYHQRSQVQTFLSRTSIYSIVEKRLSAVISTNHYNFYF